MKRFLLAVLLLLPAPAVAQVVAWQYQNITLAAPTSTTVKSSRGYVHTICVNTIANGAVITVYDNTTNSGTKIGTITSVTGQSPSCVIYDVQFQIGLTLNTATAAADITVSFR